MYGIVPGYSMEMVYLHDNKNFVIVIVIVIVKCICEIGLILQERSLRLIVFRLISKYNTKRHS